MVPRRSAFGPGSSYTKSFSSSSGNSNSLYISNTFSDWLLELSFSNYTGFFDFAIEVFFETRDFFSISLFFGDLSSICDGFDTTISTLLFTYFLMLLMLLEFD
jgi:hypothetical protein